ncbi:glycerate dehydrogenase [Candidatus Bathyarchaeota archaeon]|nr:glycerate dehydrogenase [Candidatus Bathyarchaeota archaeon]
MKIVVVDHVYLEREPIHRLQSIGDLEVFKDLPETPDELKERIKGADIVIVGWSSLTKDVIESAEKLKMVSIWATTCHYVDLQTAWGRGIMVTHVPGYATEAVAEHVFALLLAAIRKLPSADEHVRRGNFDWRSFGGIELAGKTLGIIGTGSIGCRVAEIGKAFKMQILAFDKYPNIKKAEEIGMKYVDLQTLLKQSDIVTLHVPLTSETKRLIGKKEIEAMKNGAIIINTSQGKVIDEKALIDALKSRKLSCAGLDVFEEEPSARDNPLFKLDNTILSPHCGFHTVEAATRCTDICINNIVKFLEGHPQNVCQ